ncbi:MAG: pseudouridine synthase [Phycisphaeraceae bacterium]|nr:pseudouridine synthase [Phycisphaeraceae bacterium]
MRIQKYMASAGVASRRACEKLIEDGRVRVNGRVVNRLPAWIDPEQDILDVDGRRVRRAPSRDRAPRGRGPAGSGRVYIALHKPKNIICTTSDPQGRRHVLDLVEPSGRPGRIYPVGRLDADSTGLIVLTNDGELTSRLTHPRYAVTKQYRVTVSGKADEDTIERLKRGIYLASRPPGGAESKRSPTPAARKARMAAVRVLDRRRAAQRVERTTLLITLREGQNREIRRMLERLDLKVRHLQRIAIGPLKLRGLASGAWRYLTPVELQRLRRVTGLTHGG